MNDQRWCFEIRCKQVRRPLPVHLAVVVRRALELPFVEPQLLGVTPRRFGVEHAVVGHDALEAGGVAENPVGHVSAVADRKSTRLNSSHLVISYAVFCLST